MYLLHNKIHINWPNYFVGRMFLVRECNKGSSLCYALMIAKIFKNFRFGVPTLPCISPSQNQDFNKTTMRHLVYHWDANHNVYFYRMKGFDKVIYNYDDPAEFNTTNVDEQHVEEQVHHVETDMVDTHHDDDHDWQHDAEEHEDPQGWGQWKQNSWTQHDMTYGHYSGVGSSGDESSILILLENMCVEQRERHEEESR